MTLLKELLERLGTVKPLELRFVVGSKLRYGEN